MDPVRRLRVGTTVVVLDKDPERVRTLDTETVVGDVNGDPVLMAADLIAIGTAELVAAPGGGLPLTGVIGCWLRLAPWLTSSTSTA